MDHPPLPVSLAFGLVLCAGGLPAVGQTVTRRATALTDLVVQAGSRVDRIAAGTDITAGAGLSAQETSSTGTMSASLAFSSSGISNPATVTLRETGGTFAPFGAVAVATSGRHSIEVVYSAAAPMAARLVLDYCALPWTASYPCGSFSGTATVVGYGMVSNGTPSGSECLFGSSKRYDLPVTVGPQGLRVVFDTGGRASSTTLCPDSSFTGWWTIDLLPPAACHHDIVGVGCGGCWIAAGTRFGAPGHRVVLFDASRPAAAWVFAGSRAVNQPWGSGCTQYTEVALVAPVVLDGNGVARFQLVPPPLPGLTFRLQGFTFGGVTLHTSNALSFHCP